METVTLAGGCFWCTEALFARLKGVETVTPGYTGGAMQNPSYEEVCTGSTGHAEAVQIVFDPDVISFDDILDVFWHVHDPTTLNRQGADTGPQYRSAIFYHTVEQKEAAEQSLRRAEASGLWRGPFVTEIVPFSRFYPAEEYHRDYYRNHPQQAYCIAVIDPKIKKLLKEFQGKVKTEPLPYRD